MGKKPRCKICKHRRGERRLGRMANVAEGEDPRLKKTPRACECHRD